MSSNLEAKICVLGAQGTIHLLNIHRKWVLANALCFTGVGKTSLVQRYIKGSFSPATTTSTIGASFLTKRVLDVDSGTIVRLQIWDTAGQERFRSISKLYYRGASAVILVYSIVDEQSFQEMGRWLQEIKQHVAEEIIVHVVGTKSDVVAQDPSLRKVPFERCIAYVAEYLHPAQASPPPASAGATGITHNSDSKRSSGFWGQDVGWDTCHEISSLDGEGIEEVFRVITRKLVEQRQKKIEQDQALEAALSPATEGGQGGYFDRPGATGNGSFRVGSGDKRRSWLGFPTPSIGIEPESYFGAEGSKARKGRCC